MSDILETLVIAQLFDYSHPGRYKVESHCDFHLHFSNNK